MCERCVREWESSAPAAERAGAESALRGWMDRHPEGVPLSGRDDLPLAAMVAVWRLVACRLRRLGGGT